MSDIVNYIEPNYGTSTNSNSLHDLEDYCVSVQLETIIPGKKTSGGINEQGKKFILSWGSKDGKVNFMQGSECFGGNYLTTSFTEATFDDMLTNTTNEMFGISSIDIRYDAYNTPVVTIEFVDIRGISLFGPSEAEYNGYNTAGSFFKCFFMFPYPLFKLTVKGFYGEPITYELTVADFRARFDSNNGNFNATAKFVGRQYALLNDVTLNALLAAPMCKLGKEYWENNTNFTANDGNKLPTLIGYITKYRSLSPHIEHIENESQGGIIRSSTNHEISALNNEKQLIYNFINNLKNNLFIADGHVCYKYIKPKTNGDTVTLDTFSYIEKENRNNVKKAWEGLPKKDGIYRDVRVFSKNIGGSWNITTNFGSGNQTIDYLNTLPDKERNIPSDMFSGLINNEEGSDTIYVVIYDFRKKIELIDKEIYSKESKLINASKEIDQAKKNAIKEHFGFEPNIYNISKIIMCHLDTLIYLIRDCVNNIGSNRDYSTFISDGITLIGDNNVMSKYIEPFFDCVVKQIDGDGNIIYTDAWVGDVVKDFTKAYEVGLVEELLNGIDDITEVLNLELSNKEAANVSNNGKILPILPSDFYAIENGLDIWDNGNNLENLSDIKKLIIKRWVSVYKTIRGVSGSDYNDLGRIDAINFLKQYENDRGRIISYISGNYINEDSFKSDFDDVLKEYNNGCYECINISNSNSSDTLYICNDDKLTEVKSYDNRVGNQYILINMDYDSYADIEFDNEGLAKNYSKLKYDKNHFIGTYIGTGYYDWKFGEWYKGETLKIKSNRKEDSNAKCFNKNEKGVYQWDGGTLDYQFNDLYGGAIDFQDCYGNEGNDDFSIFNYFISNFIGIDDNNKVSDKTSLFTQDWFYNLGKKTEGDKLKACAFLSTIERYFHKDPNIYFNWLNKYTTANSNLNLSNGDILPYLSIVLSGAKCWYEDYKKSNDDTDILKFNVFESNIKIDIKIKQVLKTVFNDWVNTTFKVILDTYSIKLIDEQTFINLLKGLKEFKNDNINLVDKLKQYMAEDDVYRFLNAYEGVCTNQNQLILLNRNDTDAMLYLMNDMFKKCAVLLTGLKDNILTFDGLKPYLTEFLNEINGHKSEITKKRNNEYKEADTSKNIKITLYKYIKALYDKWIGCEVYEDDETHWCVQNYFEKHFHFIDTFYNRSHDVLMDINYIYNRIIQSQNIDGITLLSFLSGIYEHNNFNMYPVQNFLDYGKDDKDSPIQNMFTPLSYNQSFNENQNCYSDVVVMQKSEPSRYLNMQDQNGVNKDDSFMLNDPSNYPLPVSYKARNNNNSLKIPCFGVSYGSQYQSYFQNIDIAMDNPVVTEHSIKAFMQAVGALKQGENTSENGNENRLITNGQYLYTIYSTNSYKCTLTMMGCPWVQPLMYFCLLNVPMFRGSYLVQKVSHKITPGKMMTTVVGTRMSQKSQVKVTDTDVEKNKQRVNSSVSGGSSDTYEKTNSNSSNYTNNTMSDGVTQCNYNTYLVTEEESNLSRKEKFINVVQKTLNNCGNGNNNKVYDLLNSDGLIMNLSVNTDLREHKLNAKMFDIILTSYIDECVWLNWCVGSNKNNTKSYPVYVQVKLKTDEVQKRIGVGYYDKDSKVLTYYNDKNQDLFNDVFYNSISKYDVNNYSDLKNYTNKLNINCSCDNKKNSDMAILNKNKVDKFIIHCTDTKSDGCDIDDIRLWHTTPDRNWNDIGYHYIIDKDGNILKGRSERFVGSHCKGYNSESIGICYIGGKRDDGINDDTRTDAQKASIINLLKELHKRYPKAKVYGHRNFSSKLCPCFDAETVYNDIFNDNINV